MGIIKQVWLLVLFMAFLLWLFSCSAYCEPWLACNPAEEPIKYVEVEIKVARHMPNIQTGTYLEVGNNVILYDIGNLPYGTYTFRARWMDMDGYISDWSEPFTYRYTRPHIPRR
jgi:hypothetical protein